MKRESGGLKGLFFIIYLAFGIYFLNYGLNLFTIPENFSSVENWILFTGGVLLIIGAINILRISRLKKPRFF